MPSAGSDVFTTSKPVSWWRSGATLTTLVLLIVALSAAISVDVVRASYKVKGDEATYVGMALSMAYDWDLKYEKRDLERFWGIYQQGPEGIFLKRGKNFRVRLRATPPFVYVFNDTPEPRTDRLYFGKAMVYSVAVAPFVWLLGMNGFYVFHVLLLFGTGICGYLFLSARSQRAPALIFTLAFFAASVVPVYLVFLTSDFFNYSLVFFAYFFWLYKEVAEPPGSGAEPRYGWLRGPTSDVIAALLLGVATYSKWSNAPLVAPLVAVHWWRRRWRDGFMVGSVSVAACAALFLANAMISGEFNYQGGDRKMFNSTRGFPFDSPQSTWESFDTGVGTNELGAQDSLVPSEIVRMLSINIKYFLFGRHHGFVPYFFPGAIAVLAWLFSQHRKEPWRLATFAGVFLATLGLLIIFPYTWQGDGGPPGNRYFLSVYPPLLFLMPPIQTSTPGLLAWIGGAMFTAKMLVNPFVAAKFSWEITERGWARQLPVELTMANSLPMRLAQPLRGRIFYGHQGDKPTVLLYYLDRHADPPEPEGMWIFGDGRAEIIMRTDMPIDHLEATAYSPIQTVFIVSAGAETKTIPLKPREPVSFSLKVSGVRGCCLYVKSWDYLLQARSTEGFIPRLQDPNIQDDRNLGVRFSFKAIPAEEVR